MKNIVFAIIVLSGAIVIAGGTIGLGAAKYSPAQDFCQNVAIGGMVMVVIGFILLYMSFLSRPPESYD